MIPKMNKHKAGDFQFKDYVIKLGLGRMASNHVKEYVIRASDVSDAELMAKNKYRKEVGEEIGRSNPIWNKLLVIDSISLHEKAE